MRRLSAWLYDHRIIVLVSWVVILISLLGVARAVGPDYKFDINISGAESVEAFEILDDHRPPSGDQLTVVWRNDAGYDDPQVREQVEELLVDISGMPNVETVLSPYMETPLSAMQVSQDGDVAYALVTLDSDSLTVPRESVRAIVNAVENVNGVDGTEIGVSGQSVTQSAPRGATTSEAVGLAAAAVILVLAFGAVLAAALPLLAALLALGASLSVVTLLTHWLSIPIFAPQLVALIGIGVGIDYALFVVSRHRSGLMKGKEPKEAMLDAMDTSGRAVIFAGITVMISILGLMIAQIGFLNGLAIATSIGVLFTMLVTVTLLPAMLGFLGMRVLGRRALKDLRENGPHDDERSTRWGSWASTIQRKPWPFIAVSVILLLIMSIPVLSMRLGSADSGTDPVGSTTRIAYDLVAEGFGPGVNGPLLLVSSEGSPESLDAVPAALEGNSNIASITPPMTTPDGEVGFMTVIPKSGPQDAETDELIALLREDILPSVSDEKIYVSGVTAVFSDFADDLQSKLPWFLVGVLGLSSLLLMVAFRSIAIPVKAAVMNLAAAGASFGVLTAVFQWGWFADMIGVTKTGPIDAFLPIMLLAILFGLSMDYQVFLVSRMREEWVRLGNNSEAVRLGLSETGKVITAAALIMIFVFAAFVFGGDRIIKMFGLGLAVAIFIDAFVIRSLLVPALMQVLGKWNWWLPGWLDKITPHVSIEPSEIRREGDHENLVAADSKAGKVEASDTV